MRLVEPVPIETYQEHLWKQGSGVRLDLSSMPRPVDGYTTFRATLDDGDLDRIFLWYEFRKHTKNGTTKLTDALPESAEEQRIRQILKGDEIAGWQRINLRAVSNFEPSLLTDDATHGPLCVIDGNHRLVAQLLSGNGFDGVSVYVCIHANMLEWAYVRTAARAWKASDRSVRQLPQN